MKSGVDYIGVGCGAIIINDNDEILLIKRSESSRTEPGTWSRPGGEVEFEETIKEAVEREVLEETGVVVKVLRFLEITENITDGKHWIAVGYLSKYVSGIPTIPEKEKTKHDDIKWFKLDSLPDNINNYTKNAINKYLETTR